VRVVLDTNVLVSALISPGGTPDTIYIAWRERRFELITCLEQLEEFQRVTRYPKLRSRIGTTAAGAMFNGLRGIATIVPALPPVERSADPADNFLLALAEAGQADYLVSGDRRGVLLLGSHLSTRIVTASRFVEAIA
jgi:putative PIN family toxin of toxin-antitoxin system